LSEKQSRLAAFACADIGAEEVRSRRLEREELHCTAHRIYWSWKGGGGHMWHVEEKYFKVLHDKSEGKISLIRLKRRWDNIKIDRNEMTIRFVIPVVFIINYNGVNLLPNTTILWRDVCIYFIITQRTTTCFGA